MGVLKTRVDPPAPGMVRLQKDYGKVTWVDRRRLDYVHMTAQIGVAFEGFELAVDSEGEGPADVPAVDFCQALRLLADRIEQRLGGPA
jgi:hypothetical protein